MTREELIEQLNNIERDYPVEKWNLEMIDIWPLVKMILFFEANKKIEGSILSFKTKLKRYFSKALALVSRRINIDIDNDFPVKYSKIDILFAAAATVRVDYKGLSYSRYFDPLIDERENKGMSGLIFEYIDFSKKNIYKENRIIKVSSKFRHYQSRHKSPQAHFSTTPEFSGFIGEAVEMLGLSVSKIKAKINEGIKEMFIWKSIWEKYIEEFSPKLAVGICYYNFPMFGLKLACQKFSIPFVDMQHGGQGILHPSYTFASKVASLNLLPDYFWIWDNASARHIAQWINNKNRIILGGNPWLDFLTNISADSFPEDRKIITFTMQLLIPDFIIEAIKTTPQKFVWFIRFHPRMSRFEKNSVRKRLKSSIENGIVNISEANSIPLPILLDKTSVHVSAYSGSLTEAALRAVPLNITIDEIGRRSFADLIKEGKCIFYNVAENINWWDFISAHLRDKQTIGKKNSEENIKPDYKKIFDELQKIQIKN